MYGKGCVKNCTEKRVCKNKFTENRVCKKKYRKQGVRNKKHGKEVVRNKCMENRVCETKFTENALQLPSFPYFFSHTFLPFFRTRFFRTFPSHTKGVRTVPPPNIYTGTQFVQVFSVCLEDPNMYTLNVFEYMSLYVSNLFTHFVKNDM